MLIVGGGPAGLAVAAELRRAEIAFRVLERGPTIGHAWRNAYDSLTLHTGRHMSALPGMPFPRGTPLFPTKDQFWDYLDRYARHHDLSVETGCEVRRLERSNDNWIATTTDGEIVAPHVVVATGIMSNPLVPDIPGRERFRGRVMHSVEYRRPSDVTGQRVLVVGVGNSGGEIASELGLAGIETTVAVRSGANVVPRQLAGIPIQYIATWMRKLPFGVRSRIASVVQNATERAHGTPVIPRAKVSPLEAVPLIGFHLVDAIRAGRVTAKIAGLTHFTEHGVRFTDGSEATFDVVILATGFSPALASLGQLIRRDEKGFAARTDRVASADQPGLYFVGQNYDSTGALRNIGLDAPTVARHIAAAQKR
ncbi:MAG: NAD(P)/FAD-dependent oxidoreductase [Gemmatimonadaceae bacterium]